MRLPDWPSRLDAYLRTAGRQPFGWGRWDCVRFAAGAVHAVTGAAVGLPDWRNRRQALVALACRGGLANATNAVLPMLPGPRFAQRGDVVMVRPPGQVAQALAVCVGHAWAAPGRNGLNYGDMAHAIAAWRVE